MNQQENLTETIKIRITETMRKELERRYNNISKGVRLILTKELEEKEGE